MISKLEEPNHPRLVREEIIRIIDSLIMNENVKGRLESMNHYTDVSHHLEVSRTLAKQCRELLDELVQLCEEKETKDERHI